MQLPTYSIPPVSSSIRASLRRVSFIVLALGSLSVSAQQTEENSDVVKMDAFEVKSFRSSLGDAIQAKRQSGQVTDLITAEEVGQFGDQNIGEALQRISGVSLTRNNGEGESVSIRGLSPEFTRVELDGRSMMVTADQSEPGRASLLSVFASDLYSQIEVVKSPTAADVEGGVGGTVRLKTANPLDIGKLKWGVNAKIFDGAARDRTEPGFGAFYSNVFDDGRLGILASVDYKKRDRRVDKVQTGDPDWSALSSNDPAVDGGYFPERLRLEGRSGDNPKLNLNGKLQFKPYDELELFLNTMITREERNEDKSRIQVQFSRGRFLNGVLDPDTNTLTAAEFDRQRVDYNNFRRETQLDTTGLSGGLKWEGNEWSAKVEGGYSESIEDFYEYTVQARINRDGVGGYVLGDDPRTPILYTASTELPLADIPLRGLSRGHRVISIDETEGKIDLERKLASSGLTRFKAGLRWAETVFSRRQGSQNSNLSKGNGDDITFGDGVSPFVLDGTFGLGKGGEDFLTTWPSIDPKDLYLKFPSSAPDVFDDNNFYDIFEDNSAVYAQVDFAHDFDAVSSRGNIGLRYVQTEVTGNGRVVLSTATESWVLDEEPSLDGSYSSPLPAFNFTLSPINNNKLLFRGALTRAMTRPTIGELNPSRSIDAEDAEVSRGNPDLEPFLAWQYDFGVEFYFGSTEEGLFSINGFYKDVDNFIVPTTTTETLAFPDQGVASQAYTVRSSRNGGAATIYGFELNLQTPFTFLPAPLDNFGGSVNYTYTDSEFTDAFGFSYSFPGASRDTANVVLYYEQGKFSTRLAYNFRNEYLIHSANDPDGANALYGEGSGRLDLSVRYRFGKNWRVSFDALNLTDEQSYKYYDTVQRYQNFEFEGKIYSVSMAYTF